jgi:hypothetical protein
MIKVLNKKIDLDSFAEKPVREAEVWLPSLYLKTGVYTDARYRLRRNFFDR